MKVKRGGVLRGYKSIVCGPLALGLAACSASVKLPSLGGPTPDQPQELDCAALNAENVRLLAEKADLKSPLPSLNIDAEREAKLKLVNGKLYTVAKAKFDKSCPTVANGPTGSVVR
jgi:hypothetical protein